MRVEPPSRLLFFCGIIFSLQIDLSLENRTKHAKKSLLLQEKGFPTGIAPSKLIYYHPILSQFKKKKKKTPETADEFLAGVLILSFRSISYTP